MNFLKIHLPLIVLLGISGLATPARCQPWPEVAAQPALAIADFRIDLEHFGTEPVNPFSADIGADTCVTVTTIERNADHVQWFYNRRLIASKNGRERVLWDDKSDEHPGNDALIGHIKTSVDQLRSDNLLLNLRDVAAAQGEITFLWDALAQPVKDEVALDGDKFVSLPEMDRLAQAGGVRLSRKVVLRRDGEAILKPVFAPKPPLSLLGATVQALPQPDENGNDARIVLRMVYNGDEAAPELQAPNGLMLSNANEEEEQGEGILTSYREEATREAELQDGKPVYRLEASLKRAAIHSIQRLRVEAVVSDGKSWPLHIQAFADVPALKVLFN